MTETHYAVVGAGRQGTAAAYDMAKYGDAASILMADHKGELAARAAERINQLIGREIATSAVVDVRDVDALAALLQPVSVFLCSTPLLYIMDCTRAAIQSATSMVDLGGHTDTVLKQLELSAAAKEKGISIVPNCGMGPGMNNTLGVYTIERLEAEGAIPREVRLWDGGLPQEPVEPWNYQVSFHINGLTNEYYNQAVFLRDGKITRVEPFTEMEIVKFAGVGELEAFVTSGGT